jgi:hypothetical protein
MRLFFFVLLSFTLYGCGDGEGRLGDFLLRIGSNPAAIAAIVAITSPLIALIPVVGAPFAVIWTKIGVSLAKNLPDILEAVEDDSTPRKAGKSAAKIVREVSEGKNPVGVVPGAALATRIATNVMVRRRRRRGQGR